MPLNSPTLLINGKPKEFTEEELTELRSKETLLFLCSENAVHPTFGEKIGDPKTLKPNALNTISCNYSIWGDEELIRTGKIKDVDGKPRTPKKEMVRIEIFENEMPLYGGEKPIKTPSYIFIGSSGKYEISTENYSECWFLLNHPNLQGGKNFNAVTNPVHFRMHDKSNRLKQFAETVGKKAAFIQRVRELPEIKLRAMGIEMEMKGIGGMKMAQTMPSADLLNMIIIITDMMPDTVMRLLDNQDTNWQQVRIKALETGTIEEDMAKMTVWHLSDKGARTKLYNIRAGETNEQGWIRWCNDSKNIDKRTIICNQALNAVVA